MLGQARDPVLPIMILTTERIAGIVELIVGQWGLRSDLDHQKRKTLTQMAHKTKQE